ncbi:MAG TPA: DUF3037 domain-containing protein [Dictyobacter sp.]|nr:DUF3037 domain-containing protein [Dictyobacter sp.]
MPAISSYDYAIIRIVPRVERGECINVGVILFCRTRRFLKAKLALDEQRIRSFAPNLDYAAVEKQLLQLVQVCNAEPQSGPIGELSQSERFHWLVAPRSTIIQVSPVHSGLCSNPESVLDHLVQELVQ